ncbi:MAG: fasciclin domain-containing protein, partial [Chloroflexi bacterium]|nr:fasciclin domain-containing protein [Chloroflexota bacterium]
MRKRTYLMVFGLIFLVLSVVAPAVIAQFMPDIFTVSQPIVDKTVLVTRVTSNGPGWVAIHTDVNGEPGPVIGYTAVAGGISANVAVSVSVDADAPPENLYAALYEDAGEEKVFDPAGTDLPVLVREQPVRKRFQITGNETTLRGIVVAGENFGILAEALAASGLDKTLAEEGPFTVFAPTDEAFAALPADTLEALLADKEQLSAMLLYHVIGDQALASADLSAGELATAQGAPVSIAVADNVVTVNDATVIAADVVAANGVVHVIDKVLLPPAEAAATEAAAEESTDPLNIVQTAVESGQFPTLVSALEAAGLVDALSAEGPFTVFAPSEEAFAALPEGQLDALLADPAALAAVLQYHVLSGQVLAGDIVDGMNAPTLEGKPLTFAINGGVTVNGAHVTASDIVASNGVIHVIDQVLLPPAVDEQAEGAEMAATAAPTPTAAGDTIADLAGELSDFSTLLQAADAAGLLDDLSAAGPLTLFAPTNAAFDKLPTGTLDALLADEAALQNVLLYHLLLDRYTATDLVAAGIGTTAQGSLVVFSTRGDEVRVNSHPVTQADIEASNGIVHVIDSVLLPPPDVVVVVEATVAPTPVPTATNTPVPTATNTATATNTPVPTATNTATATNTPVPTATNTATATNTPVPTATNTATATNTPVPTATNTATAT